MAGLPLPDSGMALVRSAGHILRHGRQILDGILHKNTDHVVGGLPRKKLPSNWDKENLDGNALGRSEAFPKIRPPSKCHVHRAAPTAGAGSGRWTAGLASYLARTTTRTLAAELRRKAALQFGSRTPVVRRAVGFRRTPLYAFVGLGVGTNNLRETQLEEEGFSHVCSQIKEMFSAATKYCNQGKLVEEEVGHHLEDYIFGDMIAKGCNSAVYPARLIGVRRSIDVADWTDHQGEPQGENQPMGALIHDMSDENGNSDITSVNTSRSYSLSSDITFISETDDITAETSDIMDFGSMSDILIPDEDSAIATEDDLNENDMASDCESEDAEVESDYPLAVKMMFNYDAESTAYSILRSMQNEAVPAKMASCMTQMEIWENGSHVRKKRLKPHPNIVDMFGVFVDDVPQMPDSLQEYPDALPQRLNPDGCGRNKTMFIVMKRYQWTLREYLSENDVSVRESTVILTQLVEAIVHLTLEGVAHRDLKSDNILLEGEDEWPHLVVTDFGCCLADSNLGLRVPYHTDDMFKGGNGTLMAPERPDVRTVANALHVLLWGPAQWRLLLAGRGPPPGKVEVIRWLLTLSAGVMCQRAGQGHAYQVAVEYNLKCMFLARLHFEDIMAAIHFLWTLV